MLFNAALKLNKLLKQKSLIVILLISLFVPFFDLQTKALEDYDNVTVFTQVNFNCTIRIFPEKRIPRTGHWMNQNIIEIRQVGTTTPLVTQVVEMDANGEGVLNPIDPISLPPGNYDIAIKGYSHLREVFSNYPFTQNTIYFDLSLTGRELFAGDTSVASDNYVNSLDISNNVRNVYTSDLKNDLNRDGVVNSLDMSNIVTNLYMNGQQ